MTPTKINFKIYQGSTFREVLRWESSTKVYKTITAISKTAPISITAVGHGLPEGWRAKITNVLGMKEINNAEAYYPVSNVTTDTFEINEINAYGFTAYSGGGIVEYNTPVDLATTTARLQVRSKVEDTEVLLDLTTENGGITIDNVNKTITIEITPTVTAALNFSTHAVYSLELVANGIVTPFIMGTMTLVKEVTR